jgi:uncharacterized protein (TIGR00369 family)
MIKSTPLNKPSGVATVLNEEDKKAILARIKSVPISEKLEMEILKLDDGYCEARVPHDTSYDGIFNCFHGGMLMTVADTIACWAVLTKSGPDVNTATTDMNIRFLAACTSEVTARARVIKFGRTMCPVAVDLYDSKEKHVAVAQVNYIML